MAIRKSTALIAATAFGLAAAGGGLLGSVAAPQEPQVPVVTITAPVPEESVFVEPDLADHCEDADENLLCDDEQELVPGPSPAPSPTPAPSPEAGPTPAATPAAAEVPSPAVTAAPVDQAPAPEPARATAQPTSSKAVAAKPVKKKSQAPIVQHDDDDEDDDWDDDDDDD